jgi:hypothetical protein
MSTNPIPKPNSLFFSINTKYSSVKTGSIVGRFESNKNISCLFLKFPQANSPKTKGWVVASNSFNKN